MIGRCTIPLIIQGKKYKFQNGNITFTDIDNKNIRIDINKIAAQIKKENIIKKTFYLGTDKYGRSVLSRLLLGVRISLLVGLIAVFISLTIGIFLGAIAGYFGGRIDDIILLLINTVWSIPTLLLVFAIVLALGRGIGIIFLAVGLTMWVDVARVIRGQVMALKEIQFVEA
ncbi:MAG TPA: ABC transporter permease, partial [Saprospiraceae bacterium]|nr:ABC transporter permease [Saprospiraceae bacterium]